MVLEIAFQALKFLVVVAAPAAALLGGGRRMAHLVVDNRFKDRAGDPVLGQDGVDANHAGLKEISAQAYRSSAHPFLSVAVPSPSDRRVHGSGKIALVEGMKDVL